MPIEWVAPIIAGLFILAGGLATALIANRTSKNTADTAHEPTTAEAWAEAERARKSEAAALARERIWSDLYYLIRAAFKSFVRRMQDLFGEEPAALSVKEKAALEAPTPEEVQ